MTVCVDDIEFLLDELQRKVLSNERLTEVFVNQRIERRKLFSNKSTEEFVGLCCSLTESDDLQILPNTCGDSDHQLDDEPIRGHMIHFADVDPLDKELLEQTTKFDRSQLCPAIWSVGIQIDMDDGAAPYRLVDTLTSHENLKTAVGNFYCGPEIVFRPRSWNMPFFKEYPAFWPPLIDLLLFLKHNQGCSPRLIYLSKLESAEEAKVWKDILDWAELKFGIPLRGIVLIETLPAFLSMRKIVATLQDRLFSLNCGIWDMLASLLSYASLAGDETFKIFAAKLPDKYGLGTNKEIMDNYSKAVYQVFRTTMGMFDKLDSADARFAYKEFALKASGNGFVGHLVYDPELLRNCGLPNERKSAVSFCSSPWNYQEKNYRMNFFKALGENEEKNHWIIRNFENHWRVLTKYAKIYSDPKNPRGKFMDGETVEDSAKAETSRFYVLLGQLLSPEMVKQRLSQLEDSNDDSKLIQTILSQRDQFLTSIIANKAQ